MSGFFGVASEKECVHDLFFGTDYHSHLGTRRGGLATMTRSGFQRRIHDITGDPFRSRFKHHVKDFTGRIGIGVISDYDDQPLINTSHHGTYAIATVGIVNNALTLLRRAVRKGGPHLSEMSSGKINHTELVAMLINQGQSFVEGISIAQEVVEGSCSILLLTKQGIFAARDRLGRTPVIIGEKEGAYAVASETCAFANLGYRIVYDLGPGEIAQLTSDGVYRLKGPQDRLQICSFLWVYYGFPGSSYEGIMVEPTRYRCGAALAKHDSVEVDSIAGIPDSGVAHAIGYSNARGIPYARPFAKYTPTWGRSFMPQEQKHRAVVARMKLIPVKDLINSKRLLLCEDSIVRGTQLQDTIRILYDCGAREVHMRPACPPLVYGCKFLGFSRSRSELELASRTAIKELDGRHDGHLDEYASPASDRYAAMVEKIRQRLNLTTLQYQLLPDLVQAIGLPKEKLCTYCWDGCE